MEIRRGAEQPLSFCPVGPRRLFIILCRTKFIAFSKCVAILHPAGEAEHYVQRVNIKLNKEMELKYGKMSGMQFSKGKKNAFKLEESGFISVDRAIKEDLSTKSSDEIVKLLGTIYRSALRHNVHSRAYIDFIHEHVGLRIGKGARLIKGFS